MKLTYKITNTKLLFLTMDESLRGKGALFTASNGIKIGSFAGADFQNNTIYLPGNNKNYDKDVILITKPESDRIKVALREFLRHIYGGWKVSYESNRKV